MLMQPPKHSHRNPGVLSILQHWSPVVFLSLVVNFALLKLFVFLITIAEPVAAEKNRLNVRLVQTVSQEQSVPPKPMPTPVKPLEPKKKEPKKPELNKRTEKPKPAFKPPLPAKIVQAKNPEPPPPKSEQFIDPIKASKNQADESPTQEQAKISEPTEVQPVITPSLAPQAPMVVDVMPLFRLTRMPKVLDSNLEILKRFYPEEERDFGKEATVEAMILVDENGEVAEVEIIKSAGARFDAAAKKALLSKALVIRPGYIGDKPVASRVQIPITFNLTD